MSTGKPHFATVDLFTHPDQVAHIVIPDGCRAVLLMYGSQPQVAPVDEPGEYEVDIMLLAKGRLPVAITVIDLAHVPAWQAMSVAHVDAFLDEMRESSR